MPTELQEQKWLIKWALHHPICKKYLIAIPNGGSRQSAREGMNLKLSGLKPGVSDLFLAYPSLKFHGLWIEMKRVKPRGKLTSEQQNWLWLMIAQGYEAKIAYGWVEAKDIIENYLKT